MVRVLCCLVLLFATAFAGAQYLESRWLSYGDTPPSDGEMYFARLQYRDNPYLGFRNEAFLTDYPEAENFFLEGLRRLTRIETGERGVIVDLNSDTLMNYPWLYAVEVGRWQLNEVEAAQLREYLLRGGFLLVDDFWGSQQWEFFYDSLRRVFPGRPVEDIPDEDPLMDIVYGVDKSIQIPGANTIRRGQTWQEDGYVPQWKGIYDDERRLMVAINFNMDLGDAWEHADDPSYPEPMTGTAIRYAVNYAIYSMTH
jgi:hypothetical protein